ncbi:MAG: hypothetical protein H7259_02400 [Cytophagales bacterium]|nr:hypothetical protein [Cytophaga sp.]
MEIFVSKKTKGIKSQIANLVAIASLDGNFSVAEKKLVFELGEKNGLSRDRVKEIIRSDEPIKFKTPDTDSLRFDRVYESIQMLLMEGDKEEEKIDFCTELAIKLGVRMAVAGVLVKKIVVGMKEEKSYADIKKESADFLNI